MDREFSDEITGLMPVVPHGIGGVDCPGCIIAVVEGCDVELRCNRCGATVGVVQVNIMEGLLGLDCLDATCPHCGRVNNFSGVDEGLTYSCTYCGKTIDVIDR
jgi:hypothetical protein